MTVAGITSYQVSWNLVWPQIFKLAQCKYDHVSLIKVNFTLMQVMRIKTITGQQIASGRQYILETYLIL